MVEVMKENVQLAPAGWSEAEGEHSMVSKVEQGRWLLLARTRQNKSVKMVLQPSLPSGSVCV